MWTGICQTYFIYISVTQSLLVFMTLRKCFLSPYPGGLEKDVYISITQSLLVFVTLRKYSLSPYPGGLEKNDEDTPVFSLNNFGYLSSGHVGRSRLLSKRKVFYEVVLS